VKRLSFTVLLVVIGAAAWWVLARTARFSIKKWDAKFETVLRHTLDGFGLTTSEILSSVHEVRRDKGGEWIVHRVRVKLSDDERRHKLEDEFRAAGADVAFQSGDEPMILVRRGGRLYQEIQLAH
jgi:hypothetical protein